jgi:peptidoglycan/LPS O-acetylase OafA/YrhL
MFVVYILFDVYTRAGQRRHFIPLLFLATIVVSGLLGELVGKFYAEPANRWLRARFGDGPESLGSVMQTGG